MKKLILLLTLTLLAGCATPYQPQGATGGFSELQLDSDSWRITFNGNGFSNAQRAQDFAMLRACQITLEHGFTCFSIIRQQDQTEHSQFTTPGSTYTTANVYGNSYQSTTTYYPGQTYNINKPSSGLVIKAYASKPDEIGTYNAAFLQTQLANMYHVPIAITQSYIPPK